jgi:serine protease AprX
MVGGAAALLCLAGAAAPAAAKPKPGDHPKLDRKLNDRAERGGVHRSRVIVILKPGADGSADFRRINGRLGRRLSLLNGQVVELTDNQLRRLADSPAVESIHWDRPAGAHLNRAAVAIGAREVQRSMGYDGAGVGVAVIDSGITSWHDDLTYLGSNSAVRVVNGQRVAKFVDFVNGRLTPYDDNGHGTHVSGIIAGNGFDTFGARAGVAPAAHIVSLKVLNGDAGGYISDVIAAFDWAVANKAAYNIRVINLSVGAAVTESYNTDPLTLAAKRAVDAGIVVVTAAGNLGKNAGGRIQYGAITAPGNAPWVLTVGADSDQGTVTRRDDVMADYSSRGPTAVDFAAKPDVVAPGTGIVSLSVPGSTLYNLNPKYLLGGLLSSVNRPYLSLTGTSMAAPMVAGTAALMIQANPRLTPNLVKAIIEYTAQDYGYDSLTQGAGFLNAAGAVKLAKFLANPKAGQVYPSERAWSKTIIWGNHKLKAGVIKPAGTAWASNIVWGAARTADGDNIVWGTGCGARADCDNIVWGTSRLDGDNIVWGTISADLDNIVWGTLRGDGDNIVWGTMLGGDGDNIVWGTACGTADCDNIVWGTALGATLNNIVWGTAVDADNIVWGTAIGGDLDNIVWGTAADGDNIVWGCSSGEAAVYDDPDNPAVFEDVTFESLFPPEIAPSSGDGSLVTDTTTTIMTTTTTTTDTVGGLLGGIF